MPDGLLNRYHGGGGLLSRRRKALREGRNFPRIVKGLLSGLYEMGMTPGRVNRGEVDLFSADPQTGEVHTNPYVVKRAADLAMSTTLGAGAIPARGAELRSGMAFDWSTPGVRSTRVGDTEIKYTVGGDGTVDVDLVKTPSDKRGQGSARRAVEQLVTEADANNISLRLTADPMEKGVSKLRLERFYKTLGFVLNKGRNKDFSTRAGMIRPPSGGGF